MLTSVLAVILAMCAVANAAKFATEENAMTQGAQEGVKMSCFLKSQAVCSTMDNCNWCTTSAWIGSGCYPQKISDKLPEKFFTCSDSGADTVQKPEVVKVNEACDKQPEDKCQAPDCVWCTSAAVGGGCYTPAQAKLLPSAIFKCKA